MHGVAHVDLGSRLEGEGLEHDFNVCTYVCDSQPQKGTKGRTPSGWLSVIAEHLVECYDYNYS